MAEPKYRTIKIPKPRSRGIRGKMALQRWQRSGGRQKQILNPKTGKYESALGGEAGQRQLQKLYPTDKGAAAEEKRGKLKKEQADRNIAGAAEAKKKAAEISAKGKKDREAKAKAKADAEAAAESKIDISRGPGAEPPPPTPKIRITEEAPKPPASSSNLADLPEIDQVKLNAVLKDLKNKVLSPDFRTPTQAEIAEAVTKATGGKFTPPTPKVAEPPPPKAEPVMPTPTGGMSSGGKRDGEDASVGLGKIFGGGGDGFSAKDGYDGSGINPGMGVYRPDGTEYRLADPDFDYQTMVRGEYLKEKPTTAEPVQAPTAVTRVPTPQAVLDANKAAGSPVADVLAIANAQKIGGDLNADQIRSLINEGKMDPDDDFFTDKEGIFGEPGLRYNKGVPETVVDQIVQDRQKAAYAAQQASGQTGPIFSVPDPQAKPLEEVAQQPTAPVVSAPTPEPTPEPAPSAPPPPQFVNMDPMQGFRETYIPTNVLGQPYDPSVRDAYTQKMMQAGANIQQGGYPMFKTPTSAIPQTQFGGYGAPMPIAPLMPYAGLAAPQPPQMASGAIVNPGTGAPMPVGMAPPPRIPGT